MKRLLPLLTIGMLCCATLCAQSPKREMRATWLTTVFNIDWPETTISSTGNTSEIAAQKAQLTAYLDKLVEANMNAVYLQIRPTSDALYRSAYEPWSKVLTGTRGKDPGYDPLAFAVEEAHKRGLELHAWINPFRYETAAGSYGNTDLRADHPEWILNYPNKSTGAADISVLDPGNPNARKHIKNVIGDILSKYNIDGIVFDDYFYSYSGTSSTLDSYSQGLWKPANKTLSNWRRENVDAMIKAAYDTIQSVKPWVRFGVSPFGIWTTSSSTASLYGLTLPSGITGSNMYETIYCNPVAWLEAGTVDYISPQLYWTTTSSGQDYDILCPWWSNLVQTYSTRNASKKFHFYSSQSLTAMVEQSASPARVKAMQEKEEATQLLPGLSFLERASITRAATWDQTEIGLQIDRNRLSDKMGAPGSVFYNTTEFLKTGFVSYLKTIKFPNKALVPSVDWKNAPSMETPSNIAITSNTLTWNHPSAVRFAIYAFPKGTSTTQALSNSLYLRGVVYGKDFDISSYSSTLANTSFAIVPLDGYGNEHSAGFFNLEATQEPDNFEITLTPLWSKSQSTSGYLGTGNVNRSVAYFNGSLYIPNSSTGTFSVINATTGELSSNQTLGSGAFWMHNLRITEDGQMLLGNSAAGSNSVLIKQSNLQSGGVSDLASLTTTGFGRTDYFFTYGSFNNVTGGHLLALSNTNGLLLKVPFANGSLQTQTTIANAALPIGTSAIAIPVSDTRFYANSSSSIPALYDSTTGALIESFGSTQPSSAGASGLLPFRFKGRDFLATPTNAYGSFEIFDVTNGLSAATRATEATTSLGNTTNATYTVAFTQQTTDDRIILYVMAPNNGIAAYALTKKEIPSEIHQPTTEKSSVSIIDQALTIHSSQARPISLYTIQGICIAQTQPTTSFQKKLPAGIYLLTIGSERHKIIIP